MKLSPLLMTALLMIGASFMTQAPSFDLDTPLLTRNRTSQVILNWTMSFDGYQVDLSLRNPATIRFALDDCGSINGSLLSLDQLHAIPIVEIERYLNDTPSIWINDRSGDSIACLDLVHINATQPTALVEVWDHDECPPILPYVCAHDKRPPLPWFAYLVFGFISAFKNLMIAFSESIDSLMFQLLTLK